MKEYIVRVTEKHTDRVRVRANSEDEAKDMAVSEAVCEFDCLYDCEIVDSTDLDAAD